MPGVSIAEEGERGPTGMKLRSVGGRRFALQAVTGPEVYRSGPSRP